MINPAFMHRCLDLAHQGRGRVGNGALVGAVLVRDEKIIAEGFHTGFGEAHAERAVLEDLTGPVERRDVLYVNLEPCCHQGKTPPCTEIIIERGIKTVVYGMEDPDSRVAWQGIRTLLQAGVQVIGPVERALCERLNSGFVSVRKRGRPWITLKKAQDAHGSIANPDGSMMTITSQEQNIWSHTFLRSFHDAILVGVGTIISDNSVLNRRFAQNHKFSQTEWLNGNNFRAQNSIEPYRIVLDPDLRIPLDATVVSDGAPLRTLLCVSSAAVTQQSGKVSALRTKGVRIFAIPREGSYFDWPALWHGLITPASDFSGLTSILVEGGTKTWRQFESANMVDEEVVLIGAINPSNSSEERT